VNGDWDDLAPPEVQTARPRRQGVIGPLLQQAFWLSVIYLVIGAAVAGIRRHHDSSFLLNLSVGLDGPAHALLESVGLWEGLLRRFALGALKPWEWRSILAAVTVLIIHAQALTLGLLLSVARALFVRAART
jgi:hypothetical protein